MTTAALTPEQEATLLTRVEGMVQSWSSRMEPALKEAQTDQDFYDGKQWTRDEIRVLEARGQPVITDNRVKKAVNGIVGVKLRAKSEPKGWPRTPADENSANLATDVLRYLGDKNRFQALRSAGFREELIWGWVAALVSVSEARESKIERIRPEEFIWDPASRELDLSDARFKGIGKWRYLDDVLRGVPQDRHAHLEGALEGAGNTGLSLSPTTDDRPDDGGTSRDIWAQKAARRVFQVELFFQDNGEWYRCLFVRGAILDFGPSAYRYMTGPQQGWTWCPIEGQRAYVDRENRPYGVVRDMRDPQRELNARRSKVLHELNVRQVVIREGVVKDKDVFRLEMARADGLPEVQDMEGFRIIDRGDVVQGNVMLMQASAQDIERHSPNPALLGRETSASSGRALQIREQAGLLELSPVTDGWDDFEMRCYRGLFLCSQQYGLPEMYVRVTDDLGAPKYVETQEPVVDQQGNPVMEKVAGPDGQPQIDPQTGQPAVKPAMKSRLAELDVDIVLDTSPDVAVLEQEQNALFSEVIVAVAPVAQAGPVLPQLLKGFFATSSFRNKRELVAAMDQAEQPSPQQQMAVQIEAEAAVADIAKTKSETELNRAKAMQVGVDTADTMRHADREEAGMDSASQDRNMRAQQMQQRQGMPPPG